MTEIIPVEEELKGLFQVVNAEAEPKSDFELLDQESYILALFQDIKKPNAKKIKKLAARLHDESKSDVQKRLCRDLYRADDPVKYLKSCIEKIYDCALLTKKFIGEGCHGMIFTGQNGCDIYPIKLQCLPKWLEEDKAWDPEQEMILLHDCVNVWMKEHNKSYFFGKALLYPKFGFSGSPEIIEMREADVTGLQKYPGSDYYVRPGASLNRPSAR